MIECTLDYGTLSSDGKKLKLVCHGLGTYEVVSGLYAFHNDVNCSYKDEAPIPPGLYYITERESGSIKNVIQNWALEQWRSAHGVTNDKSKWFSLISAETKADTIYINNSSRGSFRFHPLNSDGSGHSAGCVTFYSYNDFHYVRNALLDTRNTTILNQKNVGNVTAYGTLRVISDPNYSKCNISLTSKDI